MEIIKNNKDMDTIVRHEDYKGFSIDIKWEECPSSPREWDNLGTIYSTHRHYSPDGKSIDDMPCWDYENNTLDRKMLNKDYIWLEIGYYEHGGITIFEGFGSGWDSGAFGIIAVSKEQVRKEYGWKLITKERKEKIEEYLRNEIEIYDAYLCGDVFGFEITDEDENEIDSCYGYYGYDEMDEMFKEAKAVIDNHLEYLAKEEAKEAFYEHIFSICGVE